MTAPMHIAQARLVDLPDPRDPVWSTWLTPAELAYCNGFQRAAEHMAARLLAKRAALEVLGLSPDTPERLEIRRGPAGQPSVVFDSGGPVPGVSLTHAGGSAAAMAWQAR